MTPEALAHVSTLHGKRVYRQKNKPLHVNAVALPGLLAEYGSALSAWKDYKTFGMPWNVGYMQHPAVWVGTMRILEGESAMWIEEQRTPKK